MLSRVADSMYWMSRYVERAENLARFVDVTFSLLLDLPAGSEGQWQPLVSVTGDQDWFRARYGEATQENVVRFLSCDPDYPNSILLCVTHARENARSIRETISSEMWEHLNNFYFLVRDAADRQKIEDAPQEFLQEVRMFSHLFKGITDGTMSHGEGWQFARLGRLIERADKTSRILDVKYFTLLPAAEDTVSQFEELQWSAVLRSVSGFEMFRKRHRGITPERVVGYLILDRLFPRAIMHCVNAVDESLHAISGAPPGTYWNLAEKRAGMLRSKLAYAHVSEIIAGGLHPFLDELQTKLNGIDNAVYQTFIALQSDSSLARP